MANLTSFIYQPTPPQDYFEVNPRQDIISFLHILVYTLKKLSKKIEHYHIVLPELTVIS